MAEANKPTAKPIENNRGEASKIVFVKVARGSLVHDKKVYKAGDTVGVFEEDLPRLYDLGIVLDPTAKISDGPVEGLHVDPPTGA